MRNKNLIFILTSLIILSWTSQGFSYAKETHQAINEHIAQNTVSGFSLNNYLMENLGFGEGVKEELNGIDANGINVKKKIFWWLGHGGFQEDVPEQIWRLVLNMARNNNHFHNPLEVWDSAGLDDYVGPFHYTGQSLLLWAQNPNQSPGGEWSWQDAREYFYIALTGKDFTGTIVAPDKAKRDEYFARTFRGLGQQMHLVHDASVPEHVRNDIHVFKAYEGYVEDVRNEDLSLWSGWISSPLTFDKSILNIVSTNPSAPVPISRIIDTDNYNGTNPGITATTSIGISEYTNANFVSADTINASDFPYPQITESTPIVERDFTNTLWNTTYPRRYYLKNCCGETSGGQGYLLSAIDYLDYYRQKYPLLSFALPKIPVLDVNVYSDYASLLIPRAVGYSAGLLNYFFRGEVEFSKEIYEQTTADGYHGFVSEGQESHSQ
ncbi:MAG: hypothetical protein AB1480_17835 [Nitrospirota bacterium]